MVSSLTLSVVSPGGNSQEAVDVGRLAEGYLIGRHPDCALFVNDLTVSRRHCKLLVREGQLVVEDLGSASGTYVGTQKVEPGAPVPLADGAVLRLGDVTVTARVVIDRPAVAREETIVRPVKADEPPAVAAAPSSPAPADPAEALDPFARPEGEGMGLGVLESGSMTLPLEALNGGSGSRVGPVVDRSPAPPVERPAPVAKVASAPPIVPPPSNPATPVAAPVNVPPPMPSVPPVTPPPAHGAPAGGWAGAGQTIVQPAKPSRMPERPSAGGSASSARLTIDLNKDVVVIGRDRVVADVALESLAVSRRHAQVARTPAGFVLEDLKSTNGTYVNGQRIAAPHMLAKGDVVALGGEHLAFDGARLRQLVAGNGFEIMLRNVGRTVTHRDTGQPLSLLREVNLTINPGEFVALLGPSGAGKSVLMKAISGRERSNQGQVLYDREDFYARFESFATAIGYAPQKDIFHDTLPVVDALRYSSKLRLAKDVSADEIDRNIDRVLGLVGLTAKRNDVIKRLSGGQQKRVTIAMELLSNPKVLFLDEVTSPLDPATEKEVMGVFRDLSREGVTVICITHHANSASLCDQVAFVHDGLLTFYGPPAEFKRHFEIESIEDAYGAIKTKPAAEWHARYKASPTYQTFVVERDQKNQHDAGAGGGVQKPVFGRAEFRRQRGLLTRRYLHTIMMDVKTPMILIAMAPLVAMLVCVMVSGIKGDAITEWTKRQKILCFGEIVTALFLSLFGSIREIVREQDVYEHERLICVRPLPYLLSKILPLFVIGAIQCAFIVAVINVGANVDAGNVVGQYVIVLLAGWVGTLIGLTISAGVRDGEKAVMVMIAIVIPMILFSGAFAPMKGVSGFIAGTFCASYWAMQGLMGMAPHDKLDVLRYGAGEEFAGFWAGATMMLLHMAIAFGLAYFFLVRRDGRGTIGRMIAGMKEATGGGAVRPGPVPAPAGYGVPVGTGFAANPYAAQAGMPAGPPMGYAPPPPQGYGGYQAAPPPMPPRVPPGPPPMPPRG